MTDYFEMSEQEYIKWTIKDSDEKAEEYIGFLNDELWALNKYYRFTSNDVKYFRIHHIRNLLNNVEFLVVVPENIIRKVIK